MLAAFTGCVPASVESLSTTLLRLSQLSGVRSCTWWVPSHVPSRIFDLLSLPCQLPIHEILGGYPRRRKGGPRHFVPQYASDRQGGRSLPRSRRLFWMQGGALPMPDGLWRKLTTRRH